MNVRHYTRDDDGCLQKRTRAGVVCNVACIVHYALKWVVNEQQLKGGEEKEKNERNFTLFPWIFVANLHIHMTIVLDSPYDRTINCNAYLPAQKYTDGSAADEAKGKL
jgi:F0F1-type ATP synthase membrane subunit a